jgi:NADH:ubiquinone oxidoreductase subunit H
MINYITTVLNSFFSDFSFFSYFSFFSLFSYTNTSPNPNIGNIIFNVADVLCVILPILLCVAFMTIIERKQLAAHQRRVGPVKCVGGALNRVKLSNSRDTLKSIVPN